ncbi:tryptophan synthase subunit beta [Rubrivirga marina]|uniref:Tryptophan synthase beta chain n=1 Tax=Rubrivirga marina TaxID=1196024 RepID=A0A271IZE9_9BACT|nr:tryptophan synthase subunit beta [Rubrivirga marina]PAP76621.1 tryptophan synthase subunit beta [Rubrivirga marina]
MPTTTALPASPVSPPPSLPDARGRFGRFGGAFVPEILQPVLADVREAWEAAKADPEFQAEYRRLLRDYVGRPTPLTRCDRLTERLGGATIYAKREDLCHTGAHKINNAIGQVLLARRMGKERIIAETGAGQHGVATATACALFGIECVVYMGSEDIERQNLNVKRMRLLGAEVRPATSGSQTLKDATNEAFRDWVSNPTTTYYIIGSAIGPHPYPAMVRDLHRVIGEETRAQLKEQTGSETPDAVVACVGGGSNAIGIFAPYVGDADVRLVGVEASGEGLDGRHAATLSKGEPAVFHGTMTYLLQDADGQVEIAHSISAGLDYPGVGPEHAYLKDAGRVEYRTATDAEALDAVRLLSETEGIIPALETAHAIAVLESLAREIGAGGTLVFNCSGRGDKDMATISAHLFDDDSARLGASAAQPTEAG